MVEGWLLSPDGISAGSYAHRVIVHARSRGLGCDMIFCVEMISRMLVANSNIGTAVIGKHGANINHITIRERGRECAKKIYLALAF